MNEESSQPKPQGRVIAEFGGVVDDSNVTLAIYGTDLIPDEITHLLGVRPTSSLRRGDSRRPNSPPSRHGSWFLQFRGAAPDGPDVQLRKLLEQLPKSKDVWLELAERPEIERILIKVGIHMTGWNKGFSIPKELLAQLVIIDADLEFDIYAYDENEDV